MQVSGSCDRSSNLREATTPPLDSLFFNGFTVLFFHIFNSFFPYFFDIVSMSDKNAELASLPRENTCRRNFDGRTFLRINLGHQDCLLLIAR